MINRLVVMLEVYLQGTKLKDCSIIGLLERQIIWIVISKKENTSFSELTEQSHHLLHSGLQSR